MRSVSSTSSGRRAGVQRAVQMRVQLAILLERRARRDDAQLAALEIEPRPRRAPGRRDRSSRCRARDAACGCSRAAACRACRRRSRRSPRRAIVHTARSATPRNPAVSATRFEARRQRRMPLSVRGNPANRYVCRTSSSTQTGSIARLRGRLERGAHLDLRPRGEDCGEIDELRGRRVERGVS